MRKNSFLIVAIVCAAVVLVGTAGYFYFQSRKISDDAQLLLETERETWQERASELEQQIEQLETRLRDDEAAPAAAQALREAFGPDNATQELPAGLSSGSAHGKAMNFFRYLDEKGYAARRGLEGSTYDMFLRVVQQLDAARPLIGAENQDHFALMKNVTFFYRILGKATLLTLKDIIEAEAAIMEPVMAVFYEWLTPWQPEPFAQAVSREMMYAYAGFFVQSMAGRAYLFRRESGIRILTLYYSILALDHANQDGLNSEGIDIGPPLDALIEEMRYTRRLADRHRYLETLREIRSRY